MEFTKVTMNLTPADIENTEKIAESINARSKAQAVGTALAIAATLVGEKGSEILLKRKDGTIQQLLIPMVGN